MSAISAGSNTLRPYVAGGVLLAVAMGIGRFAYTPLLPVMRHDAGLSLATAGFLASANLAGYLLGALVSMLEVASSNRLRFIAVACAVVSLMTAAMALGSQAWLVARFLTGIASGIAFVSTISLLLERAHATRSRNGVGVAFCGVGGGIVLVGVMTPIFASIGGSQYAWLAYAVIASVASAGAVFAIATSPVPKIVSVGATVKTTSMRDFAWVTMLYTAEGFAYIIPATFLSAMVNATPAAHALGGIAWPIVGIVAVPAVVFWNALAQRIGDANAFVAAAVLQALGMLSPFALPIEVSIVVIAATLGGTFVGLTSLAAALGRRLYAGTGNAAIAILTIFYGIGQIAGPLAASAILVRTGSYPLTLLASALPLSIAALCFLAGYRRVPIAPTS